MSEKNSKHKSKPVIGISIGDVNGIGPEIIIKALDDPRITRYCTPIIYANGSIISYYRKALDRQNFNFYQTKGFENVNHKKVNVFNTWDEKVDITPGESTKNGGLYAIKSLEQAVEDLKEEKIHALVTAPLSKELVIEAGFDFPGHTEYLANATNTAENLMMMVLDQLRVAVVTGHIPVQEIKDKLTGELIETKLEIMIRSLKSDFAIKKPKIAVLGLNPHAGENGKIGKEDQEIIHPVIEKFKDRGELIFGPYPADGFFGSTQHKNFDGVLAMYHDQGLIPFKILSQGEGINFTAGLPIIRTSPAHGTAFNLAGKDLADSTSMLNSIFLAIDLAKQKFDDLKDD
jgi:4-hydroxythreonine-4-phosphate dehydrogenase